MIDELIRYEDFAVLRLSQFAKFVPRFEGSIDERFDWEFMNRIWFGEGFEFTDFLRPQDSPNELGVISLDLMSLPETLSREVLQKLRLPLQRSMKRHEVESLLGEPTRTETFVADRKTFEFTIGHQWAYYVNCTIHDYHGLIFLVVIRRDMLAEEPQ